MELLRLIPVLRGLNSPLIGIIGICLRRLVKESMCARRLGRAEADPFNLAPTASTAVSTAIGDALALAVMQARELRLKILRNVIRRGSWDEICE